MAFCTGCGSVLGDGDRFCGACGRERAARFRAPAVAAGPAPSPFGGTVDPGNWFEPTVAAPVALPLQVESFHRRWRLIRWSVLVVIACHVLLLMALMYDISVIVRASEGDVRASTEVDGGLAAVRVLSAVTMVAWIVAGAITLAWVDFTWDQLKRAAVPLPGWGHSWSAWCWLVPIVNLWMPVRVMSALLRAGHASQGAGPDEGAGVPAIKVPRVFGWWWGLFVVGFSAVLFGWLVWLSGWVAEAGGELDTPVEDVYGGGDVLMFPRVALLIISGLCFLSAVGRVGQSPMWRRTSAKD